MSTEELYLESLAVGNLLKSSCELVAITAQDILDVQSGNSELFPVRLSKGLLEMMGFVFEDLGHSPTYEEMVYRRAVKRYGYGTQYFKIDYNINWNTLTLAFVNGQLRDYRYVHELQNLYYFLTGEKLCCQLDAVTFNLHIHD
jgi:hypothetical protein